MPPTRFGGLGASGRAGPSPRLAVLAATEDGFEIAAKDLEIRGPGEFFGTRQAGLPEFRVADLAADEELLLLARREAMRLVEREAP